MQEICQDQGIEFRGVHLQRQQISVVQVAVQIGYYTRDVIRYCYAAFRQPQRREIVRVREYNPVGSFTKRIDFSGLGSGLDRIRTPTILLGTATQRSGGLTGKYLLESGITIQRVHSNREWISVVQVVGQIRYLHSRCYFRQCRRHHQRLQSQMRASTHRPREI